MYLATTGLRQYWDESQEILFLGSWCLKGNGLPAGVRGNLLHSPWDDQNRYLAAARYVEECVEWFVERLADYFNAVHHVSHGNRYWRILLAPWLQYYLHAVYDRYVLLGEALDLNPDLTTVVLDAVSYRVPRDIDDTTSWIGEDRYNLQIVSQLLWEMGYRFPARTLSGPEFADSGDVARAPWARAIRKYVRRGITGLEKRARLAASGRATVGTCDMYLSRPEEFWIAFRSGLRAMPLGLQREWSFPIPAAMNDARREGLSNLPARDAFERIFVKTLSQNVPRLYIEGYESAASEAREEQQSAPMTIASAVGWGSHERLKYLGAAHVEKGGRLVAIQHGGGYGTHRFHPLERLEMQLADRYLVWGWAEDPTGRCRNICNPMTSMLGDCYGKRRLNRPQAILFVTTAHLQYLYRFHSMPVGSQWRDYYDFQMRFLGGVGEETLRKMIYRPHQNSFGHSYIRSMLKKYPAVRIDSGKSMRSWLKESPILVIDHCGTTLLESMAVNVPSVLFWDMSRWLIRDEAQPYFDDLQTAGILHPTPESAANHLESIMGDIDSWWLSRNVQAARRRFADRFSLTSQDWVSEWARELRTISASVQKTTSEHSDH